MSPEQAQYIVLTFRAYSDDGQYVAECLELGTASQGDTPDEAIEMAYEASSMYLESAADLGELPRIFRERKVRVLSAEPRRSNSTRASTPTTSSNPSCTISGGARPYLRDETAAHFE